MQASTCGQTTNALLVLDLLNDRKTLHTLRCQVLDQSMRLGIMAAPRHDGRVAYIPQSRRVASLDAAAEIAGPVKVWKRMCPLIASERALSA